MKQLIANDSPGFTRFFEVLQVRASDRPEQRVFAFQSYNGSGIAVVPLTWSRLELEARAIAVRLEERGLAGERVVLLYPAGLEFVSAFFGCLAAGAIAVPAPPPRPNRPPERLQAILEDARPRALLTTAALGREQARWSESIPALDELLWLTSDDLSAAASPELAHNLATRWREPGVTRASLAFLQYTSGSTAVPRGVMITHGNLLHNSALIQRSFGSHAGSRGVFWLPLHHDMGLIGGVLQTIYCGGSSTLLSPVAFLQDPLRWLETISRTRATISGGPDFAYELCARKRASLPPGTLNLSSWSVAFNGAEPIRAGTLDRFAEAFASSGFRREAFLPCYGLAEATLMVTGRSATGLPVVLPVESAALEQNRVQPAVDPGAGYEVRRLVGSGQILAGQALAIVDPVTAQVSLPDRVGEIWVSGPSVARGYWNQPEVSAATFQAVPSGADANEGAYLRTGDLGFVRDGELFVTGRLKDVMIIRGRNVYPQDVEATAARSHPLLRPESGAAFTVEHAGEEALVLVHEVDRPARADRVEEIAAAIRQAIALEHDLEMHAVVLIRMAAIPRTSSGKIRRHACRTAFLDDTLDVVGSSIRSLPGQRGDENGKADEKETGTSERSQPVPFSAPATSSHPPAGSAAAPPLRTTVEIESWLTIRLAEALGVPLAAIESRRVFSELGLGSARAVALAGELQEWLGRRLSATIFYEHPCIADLSRFLGGDAPSPSSQPARTAAPPDGDEAIAIIGIGCRFPGADGPDAFWNLLREGRDATGEIPPERHELAGIDHLHEEPATVGANRWRGGFLERIDEFDADFFGIAPREAAPMDPQQRILLEVAWEALEDAGLAPERLAGTSAGVFLGISTNDYGRLGGRDDEPGEVYRITGNALSIASNRLSYVFDFRGPSLAIDTACSSSLVAVHLACGSLRSGEATLALAGGVNLILSPAIGESFRQAGMLAPDGRCKTFDARADGYVRSEGAGIVVLKPLARALADGDPIYAVIRGSAVNQDGRSNGLTAPNPKSQQAVLRAAYQRAGIGPGQVAYVEAHGTGTFLGDPIEATVLGGVLTEGRPAEKPCLVGSVKTNIGHLEAAAGVAGLIKVALALRHRAIPASLHFEAPNPQIRFEELRLDVPRALTPWPEPAVPGFAAVSSFGFGGTNAHVVLEGFAAPQPANPLQRNGDSNLTALLTISARRPEALRALASAYRTALAADLAKQPLDAIGATAAARRGHHDRRLALVGRSHDEWIAQLDAFLRGEPHPGLYQKEAGAGTCAEDSFPRDRDGRVIPIVPRDSAQRDRALDALAFLYVEGAAIAWDRLAPTSPLVRLPSYPWQRQRFWWASSGRSERPSPSSADPSGLLFELQWPERQRIARDVTNQANRDGTWLILADRQGVGRSLQSQLEARGAACRLIFATAGETASAAGGEHITPGDPGNYRRVLTAIRDVDRTVAGVVYLWGLDLAEDDHRADVLASEPGPEWGFGGEVLLLARALDEAAAASPESVPPRLWLATRGAQASSPGSGAVAVPQAPLWGVGRSLALEFPRIWGGLVDLAPNHEPSEVAALAGELLDGDAEDQVVFRSGRRHVARLVRSPDAQAPAPARTLLLRSDATYLVTGGLGDLGLQAAQWLVDRGARWLVLLGRRGLPDRAAWPVMTPDDPAYPAMAAVRRLEERGATVRVAAADVADAASLHLALGAIEATMPPLRGIVHAAGVVSGRTARDLDRETFQAVLRPKVVGTRVLDAWAAGRPLDFFVLFSSVASVLGYRDPAYAAANQWLDAFAHAATRPDRPVLSVNWGPWAGAGMASSAERARAERLGLLKPLEAACGFQALQWLLERGATQSLVVDVDWSAFRSVYREEGRRQLLDEIGGLPRAIPTPDAGNAVLLPALRAAAPEERHARLLPLLQARIARVLEIEIDRIDVGRSLESFGLDSLTAMELKAGLEADLGIVLPLKTLLEGPTLEELASAIVPLLGEATAGATLAAPIAAIERERVEYPVSSGQRALWSLHQLAPESAAYHITGAARIAAAVDATVLGRAFQVLVDRHAALRTTFRAEGGEPIQYVAGAGTVAVDFRVELVSEPDDAALNDPLRAEARRPFNLETGPLFRARLFSRSPDDHVLLLAMHHIVGDFWSIAVLTEELGRVYPALRDGKPLNLAPLADQAPEFGRREAEQLAGAEGERLWDYWRQQLAAPLPVLDLPTDRPRPPVQGERGARRSLALDAALAGSIAGLASTHGASLYGTLLAALQVLLHRYANQDDVIVGSPVAGRGRPGLSGLVGYFVNTLPMRAALSGSPSFAAFLERVKATVIVALEHQEYPFARMVEGLGLVRDPSRTPVFQVMFVLQKAQVLDKQGLSPFALRESGPRMELGGLPLESQELDMGSAQFDLTFFAAEREGGLALALEYNTDLYDAATADRLLASYRRLLEAVVSAPERSIDALPILPVDERERLLGVLSTNPAAGAPEEAIVRQFERQAALTPHAVAVAAGGEELTYAALDTQANHLAHHLRTLGIGPEARVGLCVDRSPAMLVGILGILKAGGAYVPLDPEYPDDRLAYLVADAGMDVVVTHESLSSRFGSGRLQTVCLDRVLSSRNGQAALAAECPAGLDHLAYVIYTSGSTGRPKGVMVSHRNLVHSTHARQLFYDEPVTAFLLLSSMAFDSSVAGIFGTLCRGGTLVLPPLEAGVDPVRLAELVAGRNVSHLLCVPSLYELLLAEAPAGQLDGLRVAIVAGEACRTSLAERHHERLPRTALVNEYGPTEATVWCTAQRCLPDDLAPGSAARPPVPIGRPVANTRVYVLDAVLEPMPIGVAGEIYVGGPGVTRGYLGRPELTAERFLPDPFAAEPGGRLYRTGDLGRWLPGGALEFLGRIDDQVKIHGYRIELGEVESALARHPAVRDAVVVALDEPAGGARLAAFLVSDAPQEAEWRQWLRGQLPDYMVPFVFVRLEQLPRSPNGKIDRRALARLAQAGAGEAARGAYVAPRDNVEQRLAAIVAEVLGQERVGIHDNFFDLGVDSIVGIQIAARARQAGVQVAPRQLFEHPTIAGLAAAAEAATDGTVAVLAEQAAVTGPVPLTPIQRWFFAQELAEPHHFNQAVLLETPPAPDSARMTEILRRLVAHHDALRLRFTRKESGWSQTAAAEEPGVLLTRFDLSSLPAAEHPRLIETLCGSLQRCLDLEQGPLLRAGLFDLGPARPGRLLIVIHHLAVDGVSWRILLEDLWSLEGQLARGAERVLPPKTTSLRQWSEALLQFAASAERKEEAGYWLDRDRAIAAPLPLDNGTAVDPGTVATAATVSVALDAEATERLLREVPRIHGTEINDALLAALTLAVTEWTGAELVRVDLEGHGREEIAPGIDTARTVGWFTSVFPVVLRVASSREPRAVLRAVKDELRRVPGRGIGYGVLRWLCPDDETRARLAGLPAAEIRFNYLGQLDRVLPAGSGYALARESAGVLHSPLGRRPHLLEIDARISGGRLQLDWTFNSAVHRPVTIAGVAARFLEAIEAIVQAGPARPTPADFPLARIDGLTLDRLVANGPPIDDLYPLSPVQEGMLFHWLFDPAPGLYIQQFTCVLTGKLDDQAFERAWGEVLVRHPALRTAYPDLGGDRPLQVVHRTVPLEIERYDTRGLPAREQAARFERLLEADRVRGFEPATPPLMRLALVRQGEESHRFLWTCHHIVLDGWCMSLVLGEVLAAYEAFCRGARPDLPVSPPYREYIAWLLDDRDEAGAAEAYWRGLMGSVGAATPLGVDRPESPGEAWVHGERECRLPAHATHQLRAQARTHQLTMNTLLQGAWALLLSRYSGRQDVIFGATVAGRPAELPGVEAMIGLFINTLPVRVRVEEQRPVESWLKALQDAQAVQRQYESTPLVEIQGYSGVPRGQPLFESLLVFENYPIDASIEARARRGGLEVADVRVHERTNYPLTLTVVPGEELLIRAGYDARRFDTATIDRLLGHLRMLLESLGARLDGRLEELSMLTPAEQDQLLRQWNSSSRPARGSIRDEDASRLLTEVERLSDAELDSLLGTLLLEPEGDRS